MKTVQDLVNPARQTGYDHVQFSAPKGSTYAKPYQAIAYGGKLDKAGRSWKGPRRATPIESAQDYCDYVNSGLAVVPVKLNKAGHVRVREPKEQTEERKAAYRVLRETVEERGSAGFVYCISDGTALKIGKTSNHPSNRVAELQTGNPRLLKLLAYVEADNVVVAELEMHRKFSHLNVLGEWFSHDEVILVEFGVMEEDGQTN